MRSNSKAMIRTHIEEALAGELLATDCAQHIVHFPTHLKSFQFFLIDNKIYFFNPKAKFPYSFLSNSCLFFKQNMATMMIP